MKYVVTGGAGFIGSNLVDELVSEGHEVHVIDNFISGKKENCNKDAKYHDINIAKEVNLSVIEKVLDKCDTVFHCAALARVQPSILNPIKYEKNNTIGIMNMLKCSVDMGVKRFVYSASSSAYGSTKKLPSKESDMPNPISPYANQKYYGELCCKMFSKVYNIETVSLRYFNVYGERQNLGGAYATVVGIFLNQLINKNPLTINGDGNQKRDFTYVGDVVSANILAAKSKNVGKGEVINVGNGENISINELAKNIGGEVVFNEPLNEPFANLADIKKAKKLLDWEPTTDLISWIKNYKKTKGLK
ncbi:MAG: NAD-dependent epimerase/dehydratase family protein [Pelagibacteraceae bacterium TMED124]|nr:MAG: NAD-dependent epimerase/dehydratase family protein [Pelagibacteraceae bacterium TMED124]